MSSTDNLWTVVLAAGDGTRLAALTLDAGGQAVPKQYCSLRGGPSLLQEALDRASHLAPPSRTCVIVAQGHQRYWKPLAAALPDANLIVQPENRGTLHGILLCVAAIVQRDPTARIVFLPADHHVANEPALRIALQGFGRAINLHADRLLLLGIAPDEPDSELGYIIPGNRLDGEAHDVTCFVEKPDAPRARDLIAGGAVWNSFIFGAHARMLRDLLHAHAPDALAAVSAALSAGVARDETLALAYRTLPNRDFSRDVLQASSGHLGVMIAPACGWTDLGTPRRVGETLARLQQPTRRRRPARSGPAYVNLAHQHARLSRSVPALAGATP